MFYSWGKLLIGALLVHADGMIESLSTSAVPWTLKFRPVAYLSHCRPIALTCPACRTVDAFGHSCSLRG